MSAENGSSPQVAVVLPGGGTRGAYEAGALSILLPALEARGEKVSIVCGTSVGALNAAKLASIAHRPAAEQAHALRETWASVRRGDVLAPILGPRLPVALARMLGDALSLPGLGLESVLDPRPLRDSLERWIDWMAVHRNVRSGAVKAVCTIATSLADGQPVAFVESARGSPPPDSGQRIRYQRATLTAEHVRASAAIPFLFPPVEIKAPRAARGHYVDGGTRLNAPLKPALALGADRVIVIGFEPFTGFPPTPPAPPPLRPQLADVAVNVLEGLLVDQVATDLHRMAAVNEYFVEGSRSSAAYRTASGRRPYRRISYALVAPKTRGAIGALAEKTWQRRHGGLRLLRDPDMLLMSRVLGSHPRTRGELLSFLFFDEAFIAALMDHGRRDARRWLARHPSFWCQDRSHDFPVDAAGAAAAREQAAMDEWRGLLRRR